MPKSGRPLPYASTRCNVCVSPLAQTIDQMLLREKRKEDGRHYSYDEIVAWAAENGIGLSKGGLTRHRAQHLNARIGLADRPEPPPTLDRLIRRIVREEVADVVGVMLRDFKEGLKRTEPEAPPKSSPKAQQKVEGRPVPQRREKGQHAMPKRPEEALKLEEDLLSLQRIQKGLRGYKADTLARKYGVDASTVRSWLRSYERDGLGGIMRLPRQDAGKVRLPEDALQSIIRLIEKYPEASARKLQALMVEELPEILEQRHGFKKGKPLSVATITRIKKGANLEAPSSSASHESEGDTE